MGFGSSVAILRSFCKAMEASVLRGFGKSSFLLVMIFFGVLTLFNFRRVLIQVLGKFFNRFLFEQLVVKAKSLSVYFPDFLLPNFG